MICGDAVDGVMDMVPQGVDVDRSFRSYLEPAVAGKVIDGTLHPADGAAGGPGGPGAPGGGNGGTAPAQDEDVIDAEYVDVDTDKSS